MAWLLCKFRVSLKLNALQARESEFTEAFNNSLTKPSFRTNRPEDEPLGTIRVETVKNYADLRDFSEVLRG